MGAHAVAGTTVHSCLCFLDMQVPILSQYEKEGCKVGVGSSTELYALLPWPGVLCVSVALCVHCGVSDVIHLG